MTDTTFYTSSSVLDNRSREYAVDRETLFDLIDRNPNVLATGTDYTNSSNYMTDTTAYPNNPYANNPNWICIYDRDAGIDRRDEYVLDYVLDNYEQIYIDETVIAARPPEPIQLSERELLKFLEEE